MTAAMPIGLATPTDVSTVGMAGVRSTTLGITAGGTADGMIRGTTVGMAITAAGMDGTAAGMVVGTTHGITAMAATTIRYMLLAEVHDTTANATALSTLASTVPTVDALEVATAAAEAVR